MCTVANYNRWQLNTAIHEKRELVNRKDIIFHHDNARPDTLLQTWNKLLGWDVYHIHQILLLLITTYFAPFEILGMDSTSFPRKSSNRTWINFSLKKTESFLNEELWNCLKDIILAKDIKSKRPLHYWIMLLASMKKITTYLRLKKPKPDLLANIY